MANFINPTATIDVLSGIEDYMIKYGFNSIEEIRKGLVISDF